MMDHVEPILLPICVKLLDTDSQSLKCGRQQIIKDRLLFLIRGLISFHIFQSNQ